MSFIFNESKAIRFIPTTLSLAAIYTIYLMNYCIPFIGTKVTAPIMVNAFMLSGIYNGDSKWEYFFREDIYDQ